MDKTFQDACVQVPKPDKSEVQIDAEKKSEESMKYFPEHRFQVWFGHLIEPSHAAVRPVSVERREAPVTCKRNQADWSFTKSNVG